MKVFNFLYQLPRSVSAPLLLLIGVSMVLIGVRRIQRGRAMTRWASANARIIRSHPVPASEAGYDAQVDYEYDVRGQRHYGQAVFDGDNTNMDVVNGEWRLTKYAPGEAMLVYYDPANPADSAVKRYTWSSQTSWMYIGSLLVVVGVLLMMAIWI